MKLNIFLVLLLCGLFIAANYPAQAPKPIVVKLELSVDEAVTIINAVKTSDQISAKAATAIENKINNAYAIALADTLHKDSTKVSADTTKHKKP